MECLYDKHDPFFVNMYYFALMAIFYAYVFIGFISLVMFPLWIAKGCKTDYDAVEQARNQRQNRVFIHVDTT